MKCFDQDIDTTTSAGKALFGMIAVFAEFERDLIHERQAEGMASYHAELAARDERPGPKPKTDAKSVKALSKQCRSIKEIMAEFGISKAKAYRMLNN